MLGVLQVVHVDALSVDSVFSAGLAVGGTEKVAMVLDQSRFPGILMELAAGCIADAKPLLAEALSLDRDTIAILEDPQKHFGVSDASELWRLTTEHFAFALENAPSHAFTAFLAHVEFGLRNYRFAIVGACVARNEQEVPDFLNNFEKKIPAVHATIMKMERRKAELIVQSVKHRVEAPAHRQ